MKEGNIVLTPITQTDGQVKNRLAGYIAPERHQRLLIALSQHFTRNIVT